jgi:hypothetical protein
VYQSKLQRPLIERTIDRFAVVSQLPWVCGRDRAIGRVQWGRRTRFPDLKDLTMAEILEKRFRQ